MRGNKEIAARSDISGGPKILYICIILLKLLVCLKIAISLKQKKKIIIIVC